MKSPLNLLKMRTLFVLLMIGIFCFPTQTIAQKIYSLSECIAIAQENNIAAQMAKLSAKQIEINTKSARYAQLPNLNAGVNNNYNFGRTIDPFTNSYVNESVNSVSFNLNAGVTLYNGFRLRHNISSAVQKGLAEKANLESIKNQVALDVAALYLSALMTEEQIKTFRTNISQTNEQLKRIEVLIQAGSEAESRRLEMEAQLSNDEVQLINAENNYQLALLNLKIYLNQPNIEDFTIEKMDNISLDESDFEEVELNDIIEKNHKNLPEVKRDELRLSAGLTDVKAAKSNRQPTLSMSASVNSLYSSRSNQAFNSRLETFQLGFVEETNQSVISSRQVFDFETPGLMDQFENNFGQTFGVSLSVPIFNRNQINAAIQNAEINHERLQLQLSTTKNTVHNNIQQAQLAYKAAQKSYDASLKAFNTQSKLLEQTKLSYESGASNYFDYLTVRNNFTTAEINLKRSKFDLVFKKKTFGFYLGEKISL